MSICRDIGLGFDGDRGYGGRGGSGCGGYQEKNLGSRFGVVCSRVVDGNGSAGDALPWGSCGVARGVSLAKKDPPPPHIPPT